VGVDGGGVVGGVDIVHGSGSKVALVRDFFIAPFGAPGLGVEYMDCCMISKSSIYFLPCFERVGITIYVR
jgi:hypothetical protein